MCNPASVALLDALRATCDQHHHPDGIRCVACAKRLQQAVELYRGDFLDHIAVPNSLAWDEWVQLLREQLHRQMLDALSQLVAYHEHQEEDDPARRYAWRALVLEPWNEGMHRCLMRVHARAGQRRVALAQYERCRHILAEELGIAPAAETAALQQRIQVGALQRVVGTAKDAVLAVNVASPLVAASMPACWADAHILALPHAPGGIARFGLAITEARQVDLDRMSFVALVPVRAQSLDAMTIVELLSLDAGDGQRLAARLHEHLRNKALHLVLDNFARVLDSTADPWR